VVKGLARASDAGGMGDRGSRSADYRVRILEQPELTQRGVQRAGSAVEELAWDAVVRAFAGGIGERDGVFVFAFDLVVGFDARGWVAYRLRADTIDEARELGREIEAALGPERCAPSLRTLAKDGTASSWYADTQSFEDANRASLRAG
jgi:hypothetical protein